MMIPQNIKINNVRSLDVKLCNDQYYDFMLYKGEAYGSDNLSSMTIADFSTLNIIDGKLYSTVNWRGAYNGGVVMEDIGFIGTDNGLIRFERGAMSNDEILNIITASTYVIESGDTRLFLSPIGDCTGSHTYPMFVNDAEKYIAFKGGFYQGFFKLFGYEYQTFPSSIDYEWMMHFDIRPRSDYEMEVEHTTYNHVHNKGIFFYMGTRAENKWWPYYGVDSGISSTFVDYNEKYSYDYFDTDDCHYEPAILSANSGYCVDSSQCNDYLLDELPPEPPKPVEPEETYFTDDYTVSATTCPPSDDWKRMRELRHELFYFENDDYLLDHRVDVPYIVPMPMPVILGEIKAEEPQQIIGSSQEEIELIDAYETDTETGCMGKSRGEITPHSFYTYNFYDNSSCECVKPEPPKPPEPEPCEYKIISDCSCCVNYENSCKDYFKDTYYIPPIEIPCPDTKKAIVEEYMSRDIDFNILDYTDSLGHLWTKKGYFSIDTDNKFILFDRTSAGFTTHNWEEGTSIQLTGRTDWDNFNLFPLMNRTVTGQTVHNIQNYYESHRKPYDIYKDIRNNVFALRITEEGAIGYRYGVLDCNTSANTKYTVIEEYSKNGIVKKDQWNDISIRFSIVNPLRKCDPNRGKRKMRLYFYVNGYLVLISKELNEFRFRELNDEYQKQEAVPYNMSLGGGSLGLSEAIYDDDKIRSDNTLPIEKDFCGTFYGDIKSFKIYDGYVNYLTIRNYLSLK